MITTFSLCQNGNFTETVTEQQVPTPVKVVPQSWGHCNKPTDADTDTHALGPPTTALFTANVASFHQPQTEGLSGMRPTVLCGQTHTVLYYMKHMTER